MFYDDPKFYEIKLQFNNYKSNSEESVRPNIAILEKSLN